MSVDPSELAQFSALSQTWWDPEGPMRLLHRLNPIRLGWIYEQIAQHLPGRSFNSLNILDIGCGGGLVCEPLARKAKREGQGDIKGQVTGIDPAHELIEAAQAHAKQEALEINYKISTIDALAETGAQYDVVLMLEVIEHVPDPAAFIAAACRVLRPGGLLFGATINRTLASYALAIVAAEHVLRLVKAGTHDWEKFIAPIEFAAHMRPWGVEQIAETGVFYNPLSCHWSQIRAMDVNYMMCFKKDDERI